MEPTQKQFTGHTQDRKQKRLSLHYAKLKELKEKRKISGGEINQCFSNEKMKSSPILKKTKTNECYDRFNSEDQKDLGQRGQFIEHLQGKIKTLKKQLKNTKLFLSMVIHELRNPSMSIELALKDALKLLENEKEEIQVFTESCLETLSNPLKNTPKVPHSPFATSDNDEHPGQVNYNSRQDTFAGTPLTLKNQKYGKKHKAEHKMSQSNQVSQVLFLDPPENEVPLRGSQNYQQYLGVIKEEDPSPKHRSDPIVIIKQHTLEFEEFDNLPISHRSSHNIPIIQEPKSNQSILKVDHGNHIEHRKVTTNKSDLTLLRLDEERLSPGLAEEKDYERKRFSKIGLVSTAPIQKPSATPSFQNLPLVGQEKEGLSKRVLLDHLEQKFWRFQELQLGKIQLVEDSIRQSLQSSFMITNLVNDLLDMAKMDQQTFQINCNYFNMLELVQNTLQNTAFLAKQKNIKLQHKISKDDVPFFLQLYGDQNRYIQIILNFISNSIKFTPKNGSVVIETKVNQIQNLDSTPQKNKDYGPFFGKPLINLKQCRAKSTQIVAPTKKDSREDCNFSFIEFEIRIKDNGCGISKENQENLFTNFNRLEEHRSMNHQGTGLGLSISKSLIERMGGSVSVESMLGVGTTFIIKMGTKSKSVYGEQQSSMLKVLEKKFDMGRHFSIKSPKPPGLKIDRVDEGLEESKEFHDCFSPNQVIHRNSELPPPSVIRSLTKQSCFSPQPLKKMFTNSEVRLHGLIANDEPFQLFAMTSMFGMLSVGVDTAENGMEAYNQALSNSYDFIILDLNMPIMNGMEACRRIKQGLLDGWVPIMNNFPSKKPADQDSFVFKQPYVIGMSAHILEDQIQDLIQAGFDDVVEAPLTVEFIKEKIIKRFSQDEVFGGFRALENNNTVQESPNCKFRPFLMSQ